jgi:hypothetical protein
MLCDWPSAGVNVALDRVLEVSRTRRPFLVVLIRRRPLVEEMESAPAAIPPPRASRNLPRAAGVGAVHTVRARRTAV